MFHDVSVRLHLQNAVFFYKNTSELIMLKILWQLVIPIPQNLKLSNFFYLEQQLVVMSSWCGDNLNFFKALDQH